jgi:DNA-directed RNA polymerase sigma subunit (sigma70/sigma32)
MTHYTLLESDLDHRPTKSPLEEILRMEEELMISETLHSLSGEERNAILSRFRFPEAPSIATLAARWDCSRQTIYGIANAALRKVQTRLAERGFDYASN